MTDRLYNFGCPKWIWEGTLKEIPEQYRKLATECLCEPDRKLMKLNGCEVQKGWVYFNTWNDSDGMELIIMSYLERCAHESYGSW